jgi:hypothetical protein
MVASKVLTRRRLRLIQAKKRSTTQRLGKTRKPTWSAIFLTTSMAMQVVALTRSAL